MAGGYERAAAVIDRPAGSRDEPAPLAKCGLHGNQPASHLTTFGTVDKPALVVLIWAIEDFALHAIMQHHGYILRILRLVH